MPSLKDLEPVIRSCCTEKQRYALALSAAGYGVSEIADVLDITRSTAAEHLKAAVRNVRKALAE
jgi:DNA-binding CsgD family transcriptional regulator